MYLHILRNLLSAGVVFSLKFFSLIFFRTKATWLTPKENIHWEELRLAIILNHTSLYEPLFISALPNYRLWRAIKRVVVPIADVTMNRPIIGLFFKTLVPNAIAITRKRDETWDKFVAKAKENTLILIFPEGRMKRKDGLDKHGKPMSVKGGVADILELIEKGKMLIAYSGGLHHVQAPGDILPSLFKEICITFEELDIVEYKKLLSLNPSADFKSNMILDLETRMGKYCN